MTIRFTKAARKDLQTIYFQGDEMFGRKQAEAYAQGQRNGVDLVEISRNALDGVALEYLELRSTDLGLYDPELPAVLLVAGHVGTTRLIDNIVLDPTATERAATQFSTKEFA